MSGAIILTRAGQTFRPFRAKTSGPTRDSRSFLASDPHVKSTMEVQSVSILQVLTLQPYAWCTASTVQAIFKHISYYCHEKNSPIYCQHYYPHIVLRTPLECIMNHTGTTAMRRHSGLRAADSYPLPQPCPNLTLPQPCPAQSAAERRGNA